VKRDLSPSFPLSKVERGRSQQRIYYREALSQWERVRSSAGEVGKYPEML